MPWESPAEETWQTGAGSKRQFESRVQPSEAIALSKSWRPLAGAVLAGAAEVSQAGDRLGAGWVRSSSCATACFPGERIDGSCPDIQKRVYVVPLARRTSVWKPEEWTRAELQATPYAQEFTLRCRTQALSRFVPRDQKPIACDNTSAINRKQMN